MKSRVNKELKKNLLANDYPILFEALHTCFLLSDPEFKTRIKVYRESNIEHEYYRHLAIAEKSKLRKKYFLSEAAKLENFERILKNADLMLIVSKTETDYFRKKFPEVKVEYLPSFHGNEKITSKTGKGKFILYHGKLSVPENESAAFYLVENVFSKILRNVIIAGKDPSEQLVKLCASYKNIQLIKSPTDNEMSDLLHNAHAHCLYTAQPTGLKLKLLNVLYSGRFVIVNDNMLTGTDLNDVCLAANTPSEWIEKIEKCFEKEFTEPEISQRQQALKIYDNAEKTKRLIDLVWDGK